MKEKDNLEVKEEINNKQNKIALYIFIADIIIIVGIIVGFIISNKSLNNNCDINTGNTLDDKELCQKCSSSDFPCDEIYNSRQQIEKYGFNENATISNNMDLFTEHLVDIISSPNDEFKSLSEINNNLLYYLLKEYVMPNECGWVNKSLYKEAYREIFNNELNNIDNIYYDKEVNTTNYFLSCTGRGSTIIPEFLNKNNNDNYIEYNYRAKFIDDDKEYSLTIKYKKENNNYYLNSVLINVEEDKDYEEIKIATDTLKNNWKLENFNKQYIKSDKYDYIIYNNVKSSRPFKFADESTLLIENNVGYFVTKTGKKLKIDIPDIDKIYIQDFECNGSDHIFIITTNGDVYSFEIFEPEKELSGKESFEKINLKEKIKELMILYTDGISTCDYPYYIIGITENDEKYIVTKYMEGHNKKYDFKYTTYAYNNGKIKVAYVNENRDIEINGKIIDYKFKMGLSYDYIWKDEPYKYVYDGNSEYIIVEGDYLYSIIQEKIVNNSKIKHIYAKNNGENFKIVFENNSTFEFSNV